MLFGSQSGALFTADCEDLNAMWACNRQDFLHLRKILFFFFLSSSYVSAIKFVSLQLALKKKRREEEEEVKIQIGSRPVT